MNRIDDIENRVKYLESELIHKDEHYDLECRIEKLEGEVTYQSVYIYITVFYIIYFISKQLTN